MALQYNIHCDGNQLSLDSHWDKKHKNSFTSGTTLGGSAPRTGQNPKLYRFGPNFTHLFSDIIAYSVPNISQIPGVVLEQSRSKVDKKVTL